MVVMGVQVIGVVEVRVQPQLGGRERMLDVVGVLVEVGWTLLVLLLLLWSLVLNDVQGFAPAQQNITKYAIALFRS